MRSITVTMWVTVDGVVQGLGRGGEDTRGGFTHGGWGPRYDDEVMSREMAKAMTRPGDMLLGRRTWQDFTASWGTPDRRQPGHRAHERDHQIRCLEDSEGCGCVAELGPAARRRGGRGGRAEGPAGGDLGIIGSVSLVRSLHAVGLIDGYTLLICPLALDGGARLFEGPAPLTEFELTSSVTTTKGVIIAQYSRR